MLVIRRRAGEGLIIHFPGGESLEIDLLEIEGSQVKLGFAGPRQVRVLRREIAETEQANVRATETLNRAALDRLSERLRTTPNSPSNPSSSHR
jgi:carbon storage regulator